MSIVDRKQNIIVPYSLDDIFEALKRVIPEIKDFKASRFDEDTKTVHLKTRVSWVSYGEKVTISLTHSQNGGTDIFILSTPWTGVLFGGLLDWGKNRDNIRIIIRALLIELKK